jgi:hypothetical protein
MSEARFSIRLADGRQFGPTAMDVLVQWAREGRVPPDASLIPADGGTPRPASSEPALAAIVLAPPTVAAGLIQPRDESPASALIPYKNPPALIGYYLAVFSLVPVLGVLAGIPAVICGIVGWRRRLRDPRVRGLAHAIIAVVLGSITTLVYSLVIVLMIIGSIG